MLLLLAERKLNNNVPFPLVNRDESKLNLDKSAFSPFSLRKRQKQSSQHFHLFYRLYCKMFMEIPFFLRHNLFTLSQFIEYLFS